MSEAILRLSTAGGEEMQRVLGNVRNTYRNVAQVINSEARRAAREREKIEREAMRAIDRASRDQVRTARAVERETTRIERERTKQTLREAAQRQRAEERVHREIERAQRQATRIAEAESKRKVRVAEREARDIQRLVNGQLVAREQAERRATEATEREARRRGQAEERAAQRQTARRERERQRDRRETGRQLLGAARGVAGFAGTALSDSLSQIQDAEQRRAAAGSVLYNVARQTGASATENAGYVRQFQDFSAQHGIPMEVLVSAAAGAQGTFSTLAGDSADARGANVQRFLAQALEARTIAGTDSIAQHTMLAGLINQIGGPDSQQRATRLGVAHLAELGAIEETQVVAEAMPALMAQVGAAQGALGPNANAEQLTQAGHTALIRGVAEMEVMRGTAGYRAGRTGNIFSAMAPFLSGDVGQQRILTNVQNAHISSEDRASLRNALFHRDAEGHQRLNEGLDDPVRFASVAAKALHGNRTAFQNIFAGGGHGNPMALQANWRNLSAAMFNRDASGEAGYQRIERFARASAEGISDQDMQRRQQLTAADPMTQYVQREEERLNALTRNNEELHRMNDNLQAFNAAHPLVSGALKALPGGDAINTAVAQGARGMDDFHALARGRFGSVDEYQRQLQARYRANGGSGFNATQALGTASEQIFNAKVGGVANEDRYVNAHKESLSPDQLRAVLEQAVARGAERGIQQATITATVSPTDAAHAVTTGAARPPQ